MQSFLGHSNAATTLAFYAHLWGDDEDRVRAALDDVLGGSCVTSVSRQAESSR